MGLSSPGTTGTDLEARDYSREDRLLDGRPVLVRAIRPEDKRHLKEGFRRLSLQSVYHRFFQAKKELSEAELRYLTELDFETHVGLLVVLEEDGREAALGVGRYIFEPGTGSAEVAFTVDEAHHGLGVATILLRHLAVIGRRRGLSEFRAYVLAENRAMLEVFENAGFPLERRLEGNVIVATLGLGTSPAS
jgi:RimJ/RimL family protein N-acetyltransferase